MNITRNAPIGLIDSGIGGLAMLKALTQKYPSENYIYLADNLNMPYGNKTSKFIKNRLLELVNYLHTTFNVKLVILACNTASISALDYVSKHSPVQVIGLDWKHLAKSNYSIICTKLASKCASNLNIHVCNKLASIIEDNIFDIQYLKRTINNTLTKANIVEQNIVLGCTHYELVAKYFNKAFPDKNFILPCKQFVDKLQLNKPANSTKGDILMIATLPTKSYIDKLWKIFKM